MRLQNRNHKLELKVTRKMLRFFSRRKVKGRADQKIGGGGAQGGRRFSGKYNKNILNCNIMLLDGSDLAIEIGVSFTF